MSPRFTPAMIVVALLGSPALAQPPGPPPGPRLPAPFSPYLNLARGGVNPAINYYGIVRPQTQFADSIQAIQTRLASSGPFVTTESDVGQVVTGQGFGFQNHLNYFQNYGAFRNPGPPSLSSPTGLPGPSGPLPRRR